MRKELTTAEKITDLENCLFAVKANLKTDRTRLTKLRKKRNDTKSRIPTLDTTSTDTEIEASEFHINSMADYIVQLGNELSELNAQLEAEAEEVVEVEVVEPKIKKSKYVALTTKNGATYYVKSSDFDACDYAYIVKIEGAYHEVYCHRGVTKTEAELVSGNSKVMVKDMTQYTKREIVLKDKLMVTNIWVLN
jgi:hypothetical protein